MKYLPIIFLMIMLTGCNMGNPIAVFETSQGTFEIELYQDKMPVTVNNFVKLVNEGYYDNQKFHRIIKNFMIQGGDPLTKDDKNKNRWGTGGPGYTIQDEFVKGLSNVKGTISMANTGRPNSGGSQFFINTNDNLYLDFDKQPFQSAHPVFGHVISGMDIVEKVGQASTDSLDRPTPTIEIISIKIR